MGLASRIAPAFVVTAVLSAGAALAFAPTDTGLELPLEWESKPLVASTRPIDEEALHRSGSLTAGWFVQRDPRTGLVRMAYGGDRTLSRTIAGQSDAFDAARGFLLENANLLGVRPENMEPLAARSARGKWAAHFGQSVDGVPVWRAKAFVLMSETGRVIAFGSDFVESHEAPARPSLPPGAATARAAASIGATPRADRPVETELWYVPVQRDEHPDLAPAYRVVFEANEPFGKWATFVDAVSGEILGRTNLYHRINVVGTVEADVQNLPPSYGWCDGSAIEPVEHLTVNVQGGNSDDSDTNGDFVVPHGGFADVTVEAELLGPFSDVNRFGGLGPDASFSDTATPGTPLTVTWDGSNSRQDERTTFFQANRVHDFMTALDPTFTELDYSMPSTVGRTDGFCPGNAWWDGFGMNYCEESVGANRANTGELGNVIYHEFGHGVTQEVYQRNNVSGPPGDLHEGNSDVLANFLDRNSVIGLGFFLSTCASGIRDADNTKIYPDDLVGEGHADGEIIAGFHWDAWQSMLGSLPQAEADEAAFTTWHLARDMGLPYTQPDQVLWTFLMDDDDAFLNNGTPHYDHFALGAANHGFDAPIVVPLLIQHDTLPHTLDGSAGFTVDATILEFFGTLDPSSVELHWRVDGGAFDVVPMAPSGPGFSGSIPPISLGEVDYYISAKNTGDSTATSPLLAPAELHQFDVATVINDMEQGVGGWTVTGNADTGHWELVDPIGTSAQPEDDATPGAGTMCWITGQCDGPNCDSGCTISCNDVDNGLTRLFSPVFPLTGATNVVVKYSRWFSGDEDPFRIAISNDGGGSFTLVEDLTEPALFWSQQRIDVDALFGAADLVQLRFIARDNLFNPSTVEAGIDDFRILAGGVTTDAPDATTGPVFPFDLAQNQPNPFRPATGIVYSVPAPSEVELTIYDVQGRAVRTLVDGFRPAGPHEATWDGRDPAGRRVAAGVYFYRLVAGERTLTRKMTVLR